VQDQHVDRDTRRAIVLIRAVQIPDAQTHKLRSRLI
jgi:hypothetical protein